MSNPGTDAGSGAATSDVSELEPDVGMERVLRAGLEASTSATRTARSSRPPAKTGSSRSRRGRSRSSPSSAARTSASRHWSTGSSAGARPSSRTPRASPATGSPTTPSGTGAGSRWSTPAGGRSTRRGMATRVAEQAEVAVDAGRRRPPRRRRDGRRDRHRRGGRPGAATIRQAGRPGREQGRRPAPEADASRLWSLGLGAAVAGLRAARPGERRPARRGPRGAAESVGGGTDTAAAHAGWRCWASRTSASPRCSTGWRGPSGWSSTRSRAPPATRSTS